MSAKVLKNDWGGLFNKERFEWMAEKKLEYLRNLTIEKSAAMLEALTSPKILNEFRQQSVPHAPLCLKLGLMVKKDEFASKDI